MLCALVSFVQLISMLILRLACFTQIYRKSFIASRGTLKRVIYCGHYSCGHVRFAQQQFLIHCNLFEHADDGDDDCLSIAWLWTSPSFEFHCFSCCTHHRLVCLHIVALLTLLVCICSTYVSVIWITSGPIQILFVSTANASGSERNAICFHRPFEFGRPVADSSFACIFLLPLPPPPSPNLCQTLRIACHRYQHHHHHHHLHHANFSTSSRRTSSSWFVPL